VVFYAFSYSNLGARRGRTAGDEQNAVCRPIVVPEEQVFLEHAMVAFEFEYRVDLCTRIPVTRDEVSE